MHDRDCPDDNGAGLPETTRGELGHLLREIEKEPMPERLLQLALKLQAALVEQRKRH